MNTTPHPYAALVAAIEAIVDAKVSARLQQAGHTTPGPRSIRTARGVDLPTLAAKSGISKATISRLERGEIRQPKIETLNALARALGVSEQEYRQSVATLLQATEAA